MPSLPYDGQTDWGDILNTYINNLSSLETSTQTGLQNHAGNSPADPHGDRAYALSLVNPLVTGLNAANGLVKLNSSGTIPANLITASSAIGGLYTAVVDAVAMFGATAGTNTDQSAALQAAMTYVANLGGGIVYIGPGTFSVSSPVFIGSNTWVLMSPGTVIQRIPGSPNAPYIFTNIQLTSTASPASNVRITGGKLDAIGSFTVSSACTVVELFQGSGHIVEYVQFNTPNGNSHGVEVNGGTNVRVSNCTFSGTPSNTTVSNSAVFLNASTSAGSPAGLSSALYTNQGCSLVNIENCMVPATSGYTYAAFGCLAGSDVGNSSAVSVTGVSVTGCYFSTTSPNGPIYSASATWSQQVFNNNEWGDGKGNSLSVNANASIAFDTWTTLSLTGSFTSVSGGYPLQYRISQDGIVSVFGAIHSPSSSYNNVTIATLPYHPTHPVYSPLAFVGNTTDSVFFEIDTSGHLTMQQGQSGNNDLFVNINFPADYAGNGLHT